MIAAGSRRRRDDGDHPVIGVPIALRPELVV
jgi:hypothetical protein